MHKRKWHRPKPRNQCCQPEAKYDTLQSLPFHSLVSDKFHVSNAIHHGQGVGRLNKGGIAAYKIALKLQALNDIKSLPYIIA